MLVLLPLLLNACTVVNFVGNSSMEQTRRIDAIILAVVVLANDDDDNDDVVLAWVLTIMW